MRVIDGLETLEGKGRASTVTEQPFQSGTIPSRNPHRGIEREAPVAVPFMHLTGIVGVEQSPADEPTQHAPTDPGLDRGDSGLAERGQLADAKLAVHEVEHRIDDAAVVVDMLIERIAKAMDETDGAETGVQRLISSC